MSNMQIYFDECSFACGYFYDPNRATSEPEDAATVNRGAPSPQGLDDFTVVPNPVSDQFTIRLDERHIGKAATLEVIDQMGRLMIRQAYPALPQEQILLESRSLPAGLMHVRVTIANQQPMSKIIVVARP